MSDQTSNDQPNAPEADTGDTDADTGDTRGTTRDTDPTVETFQAPDANTSTDEFRGNRVVAWEDASPVTQADADARVEADGKSEVEVAGPDLLGEPSQSPGANRVSTEGYSEPTGDADTGDVPTTASDVVAWIKEGETESEDEARRRAGLAWTVEAQREGGVRTTVEQEVDRHLDASS